MLASPSPPSYPLLHLHAESAAFWLVCLTRHKRYIPVSSVGFPPPPQRFDQPGGNNINIDDKPSPRLPHSIHSLHSLVIRNRLLTAVTAIATAFA